MKNKGYLHGVRKIAGSGESASALLPHVHLVVSLPTRWVMGTHQGAVSPEHLPYYLDEYALIPCQYEEVENNELVHTL